jgi:predicted nucleic-acid-binding protein
VSVGLDSSVVLRLLVGQPVDQAEKARVFLERSAAAGEQILVSDTVLAEAYHALHYHYKHTKEDAREYLKRMVTAGSITLSPPECLPALDSAAGAGLVDRLILCRYTALNVRTLTFDRALGAAGAERIA